MLCFRWRGKLIPSVSVSAYITLCKSSRFHHCPDSTHHTTFFSTYPSTSDVERIVESPIDETTEGESKSQQEYRPKIAGAFVMCPLVNGESDRHVEARIVSDPATRYIVAPASRPNFFVEGIARVIVKFAGSLPLAEAVRGELLLKP